jgi:hypothetical protein
MLTERQLQIAFLKCEGCLSIHVTDLKTEASVMIQSLNVFLSYWCPRFLQLPPEYRSHCINYVSVVMLRKQYHERLSNNFQSQCNRGYDFMKIAVSLWA